MMTELENLKSVCAEKQKNAINLNITFCNKLILRDMEKMLCKNANIVRQAENKFIWDHIFITVNDGLLNVEDRRGEAFLWGFEINHNKIRLGDVFMNDGQLLSVSYLRPNNDSRLLSKVRDVIAEFDESISILSVDNPYDTWSYKYYDCHEEVTCDSIEEIFDVVIKRKYRS